MRKPTFEAVAALALLLAACGSDESPSPADVQAAVNNADAMAEAAQDKAEATPTPAPRNGGEPRSEIPEPFQGRWGLVAADCEPGRADAKGLMDVGAHRLVFYESRATPTSILQATPNELMLQLTFAGEGQTWERSDRLTLLDGGRTLVRDEIEPAGTFRYTRCGQAQ